ncbi:hypothetical protein [Cellulosimicrobium cellulans]|uniref:hypothetical protein n=1 Tax=Cellulosimicrobium cellulans TaxID=1710 RepID=UPI0008487FF0|nr:hypothetical protein [Cellulosimicrobium cellulans]
MTTATPDGTSTTPPHRTLLGRLDAALTAPDATGPERALGYGSALVGAALAVLLAVRADLDAWQVALLALVGFDLFGGVVVNATVSGSRRFHAPGTPRRGLVTFTAVHVHPLVVAALVPGLPWSTALVTYAGILAVVVVVAVLVPDAVRAPVAFAGAAVLVALLVTVLAPEPWVAWVGPLLVLKLVLSHALPHPADASA